MGSIFLLFMPLQAVLFIYMLATRAKDPSHYKRYKMLQEFLI